VQGTFPIGPGLDPGFAVAVEKDLRVEIVLLSKPLKNVLGYELVVRAMANEEHGGSLENLPAWKD
jgi:hypothetical protein